MAREPSWILPRRRKPPHREAGKAHMSPYPTSHQIYVPDTTTPDEKINPSVPETTPEDKTIQTEDIYLVSASLLTVLFVVGVLCNVLTISVLRRRNTLGTRLLLYLSYVDVTFIILVYVQVVLPRVLPEGTNILMIFACLAPFMYPLLESVYTAEVYITVLIAVQRSAILAVPLKYIRLTRDTVFNRCLIGIALAAVVFNVPEWISNRPELYWNREFNMTFFKVSETPVLSYDLYRFSKVPVNIVIPLALILLCDVVMVVSKIRSVTRIGQENRERGRNQLTNIVIAITTVSVILEVSVMGMYCVYLLQVDITDTARLSLNLTLNAIIFTNSSINFIFYCLLSSGFRQTLKSLCRKKTATANRGKLFELGVLENKNDASNGEDINNYTSVI